MHLLRFGYIFEKKSSLCNYSVLDVAFYTFLKFCPFLENISKQNIIPLLKRQAQSLEKIILFLSKLLIEKFIFLSLSHLLHFHYLRDLRF